MKYIIVIVSLFATIPECVSQNPVLSLGEHPKIRAVERMKSVYIFIGTPLLANSLKAQDPVLALGEHRSSTAPENTYLKDIDNVLNTYEGTWLYDQNGIYLKMILKKRILYTVDLQGQYVFLKQ